MPANRVHALHIGPHVVLMASATTLQSTSFRVGALLTVVIGSPAWADMSTAPLWVRECLVWLNVHHTGALGAALAVCAVGMGTIRAATTRYEIREYGITATVGFFSSRGARGFRREQRTLSLLAIRDAQSTQGILQALFGVGQVTVRSYDGEEIRMPFTFSPAEVSAEITRLALMVQRATV